ncbi:MAG: glycosyltransferase family 4 protein [Ignavibacteria bacterium]|nr:glycosyltransferase family 4 protein [Ignavibacteria bacterium]
MSEQFHFVYVGRLLKDKQIDILLKAFSLVEKDCDDCRLTIIGDGPEKNNLFKLSGELKIRKIHFTGEILDEEQTGKWIYISDAFVMPGRLGLSVVHSFCFGTPVISQRKEGHFHGEGIGYIIDGENGFLSADSNEKDMAFKMKEIISDAELSKRLRENAFAAAKNVCSIENMLNGFEQAIEFVSKK